LIERRVTGMIDERASVALPKGERLLAALASEDHWRMVLFPWNWAKPEEGFSS
jgi:hypothetical protein